MSVVFEGRYVGDILHWEEQKFFSREEIALPEGTSIKIGTILGRVTKNGQYAPLNPKANNGTEVAAAISISKVDYSSPDTRAIGIARHAIVKLNGALWPEKITVDQIDAAKDQLEKRGILMRE